jgi:SAM-dependent methyltransferase
MVGTSTTVTGALEEAIRFTVPWTAAVAVVLPEDAEPPQLDGRRVFTIAESAPDTDQDGALTLARLEALRGEHCEYLIVPAASLGWLDERPALRGHLEKAHRLVLRERYTGAVFALHGRHDEQTGPDGVPVPPIDLVRITSGCINQALRNPDTLYKSFFETGALGAKCIREALGRRGIELEALGAMLDLGCGCGRVIRHWRTLGGPELHGCDYNPHLVKWCSAHLRFARFAVNPLAPNLPYRDEQFDLVYAISVFTHLDAPLQLPWIAEVARVVKPGGHILVTVSGQERAAKQLNPADQARFRAGELVVRRARSSGTNACAVFHPEPYVREMLGRELETIEVVPGGARDVWQDQVLFAKPVQT